VLNLRISSLTDVIEDLVVGPYSSRTMVPRHCASKSGFLKPHFICNLYIYIQEIDVRIGCYGLGN
jgi:hypothetical protein